MELPPQRPGNLHQRYISKPMAGQTQLQHGPTQNRQNSALTQGSSIKSNHMNGEKKVTYQASDLQDCGTLEKKLAATTTTTPTTGPSTTTTTQVVGGTVQSSGEISSSKRRVQSLPLGTGPQRKVSRRHVVKPDFDVIYAEFLLKLSRAHYLIYGVDDDGACVIRIQDCSYTRQTSQQGSTNDGGANNHFVPRCVKFTQQQWVDLLASVDDVTDALQSVDEYEGDDRIHIGGNTFITVKAERGIVDIREFYLPKGTARPAANNTPESYYDLIFPTKRGVQLSVEGWSRLISKGSDMVNDFALGKISVNQPCFMSHTGSIEDLCKCSHCNPNGYTHG
jgi:hypothetical protein